MQGERESRDRPEVESTQKRGLNFLLMPWLSCFCSQPLSSSSGADSSLLNDLHAREGGEGGKMSI